MTTTLEEIKQPQPQQQQTFQLLSIDYNYSNHYAIVKFKNNPVNSFTIPFMNEIINSIKILNQDKLIYSIIFISELKNIFSAGLDLKSMFNVGEEKFKVFWSTLQNLFLEIYSCKKFTIALINGQCLAGGCLFALCCDYRMLLKPFKIGLNETQFGLVAPWWFAKTLQNVIGQRKTEYHLQLGSLLSTEDALSNGYVDEIFNNFNEMLENAMNQQVLKFNKQVVQKAKMETKWMLRRELIEKFNEEERVRDLEYAWSFVGSEFVQNALGKYLSSLSSDHFEYEEAIIIINSFHLTKQHYKKCNLFHHQFATSTAVKELKFSFCNSLYNRHGNHHREHEDHNHDGEDELLPTPKVLVTPPSHDRNVHHQASSPENAKSLESSNSAANQQIINNIEQAKSTRLEERKKRREKSTNYLHQPLEQRIAVLEKYFGVKPEPGKSIPNLTKEQLVQLLQMEDLVEQRALFDFANSITEAVYGTRVYFRGIIEFSNVCQKDCMYCGIRKHMKELKRYSMPNDEIVEQALWAYENHFGSIMLQSGELNTKKRLDNLCEVIKEIKEKTGGGDNPHDYNKGLGIALGVGELSKEDYQRLFDAGAHRYLLRIETSNPELYRKLHPNDGNHQWEVRKKCLEDLMEVGFQTGTGVMIMIPGQTLEDLANDLLFFKEIGADMIGMGPYIKQDNTPIGKLWEELYANVDMKEYNRNLFRLSLKMVALARILMKDVNISATTALQAINPAGREIALNSGANMVMPIITPTKYRVDYQLYQGKPCIDDTKEECKQCLTDRVKWSGKQLTLDDWGDPIHYFNKRGVNLPSNYYEKRPTSNLIYITLVDREIT
ncbi:hypothetical protein ABK040_006188 [Willaertia magna]